MTATTASLTVGSLFSGIGGLDLGLERLGAEVIWQSEIDKNPSAVLAHRFPGIPNLGDIREIEWSSVDRPDILCGGYPCQPFSFAGKREGEADPRHLWPAFRDAIRHLRPGLVVLENVRGHLTLGFGSVLGDLCSLGYDASWQIVRASDVGAPHRRERLFVVATDASNVRHERRRDARRWWKGSADHGSPVADAEVHEQREPAIAGPLRPEPGHGGDSLASDTNGQGLQGRRRDDLASREGEATTHGRFPWGDYADAVERWERIIGRPAPHPSPDGRLAPEFVEWMMGFPQGWVSDLGLSRTAQLKALGNAVVPQQAEAAVRVLL